MGPESSPSLGGENQFTADFVYLPFFTTFVLVTYKIMGEIAP